MACIRKRRGRYVIDFYDSKGVRRWKTMPEGATKDEAQDKWEEIRKALKNETFTPDKEVLIFSQVAEEFLDYKKPDIRETTWEVMEGMIKNHFNSIFIHKGRKTSLDKMKINRISTEVIEKWIRTKQKEGIHILTLRKILVTLGQIMAYAVRHKLIGHNPVTEAERPKDQRTQENEIRILNPSEIRALLDAVEDQKHRTLFLMAIMTGARQGELLGLKWGDLDLEKKQVYIQRTFNNGREFPTKTKGSKRKVDLSPSVMLELKKWKLACPKTKPDPRNPNGPEIEIELMFPNEAGEHIDKNNLVKRYFEPALEKAGIIKVEKIEMKSKGSDKKKTVKKIVGPRVRFHDIRHTYASLMIEQGENIKYIQTQLGHSSPMVTLTVYAHLMKESNQEAVCKLENTILGG